MNYEINQYSTKYTITILLATELQKKRIVKLLKRLIDCENINELIEGSE